MFRRNTIDNICWSFAINDIQAVKLSRRTAKVFLRGKILARRVRFKTKEDAEKYYDATKAALDKLNKNVLADPWV
jgi:hypothetical protein